MQKIIDKLFFKLGYVSKKMPLTIEKKRCVERITVSYISLPFLNQYDIKDEIIKKEIIKMISEKIYPFCKIEKEKREDDNEVHRATLFVLKSML